MSIARYRYRRERVNGKSNETTVLKVFEKWLIEAEDDDRFFVAECRWVECTQDGMVPWTTRNGEIQQIPHVWKVREIELEE